MKVRSRQEFNELNQLQNVVRFEYDAAGNLVEESQHDSAGRLISKAVFEYDELGHCVLKKYFDAQGKCYSKVEQSFDAQGRKTAMKLWSYGAIDEWETYEYPNATAKVIRYLDEEGALQSTLVQQLDTGVWEHLEPNGKVRFREKLTYDDKGRMLTRKNLNKKMTPQLIEHTYDTQGSVEHWSLFVDGILLRSEERNFNEEQQLIKLIQKDKKGQTLSDTQREYDQYGNVTKEVFEPTGQVKTVRRYVIEYLDQKG